MLFLLIFYFEIKYKIKTIIDNNEKKEKNWISFELQILFSFNSRKYLFILFSFQKK